MAILTIKIFGAHFLFRARFPCFSKWMQLLYVVQNEKVAANLFCWSRFCAVKRIRLVLCFFSSLFFAFQKHVRAKKKEEERRRKRVAETLIVYFWIVNSSIVTSKRSFPDIPRSCPRACWAHLLHFSAFIHCESTEAANERKLRTDGKLRTKEN